MTSIVERLRAEFQRAEVDRLKQDLKFVWEDDMAARDYILCETCNCKVVYDGDDNGRNSLEQNFDVRVITCPACVKALRSEVERLRSMEKHWRECAREQEVEIQLRASYTSLLMWLQGQGLLVRHAMCTKPDNTFGPAWVLRGVATVDGDSCLGWGDDPVAAVDSALKP